MRLTCPNCDAEYEVPDDVVPQEGRDVQCSNCGKTWFQHHPDHAPEESTDTLDQDDNISGEEHITPEDILDDIEEEEDVIPAPPPVAAKAQEVDPSVADILRQEADLEREARRATQTQTLESQPDLGLPDTGDAEQGDTRQSEARQRMARMRGEPEPIMSEADVNAAALSSRRDLLPDIEEINSTLRTDNDRAGGADGQARIDAPSEARRKRGFRRGFMMVIVLFVLLALLYIYAPRLAQTVPALDAALTSYVSMVDQMRLWLDGRVQAMLRWLDNVASQSGE